MKLILVEYVFMNEDFFVLHRSIKLQETSGIDGFLGLSEKAAAWTGVMAGWSFSEIQTAIDAPHHTYMDVIKLAKQKKQLVASSNQLLQQIQMTLAPRKAVLPPVPVVSQTTGRKLASVKADGDQPGRDKL